MPARIDGIVSGFNTTQLINQIVAASSGPMEALGNAQSALQTRRTAYQELNSLMATLQTSLQAVDADDELGAYTATSQQDGVSVLVTGAPSPASHTVNVIALAEASLQTSTGFATATSALAGGSFDITVGTTTTTVDLTSVDADTLAELAAYINENVGGAVAWVMNTGVGATPYQLMIQAEDTGVANAVSISNDTTAMGFSAINAAADASLTIDTVAVTSASNTLTDVLPGLTLDLTDTTTGTNKVTVSRDATTMQERIQTVVDAYNAVIAYMNTQSGLGDADPGPLGGETSLMRIRYSLSSVVTSIWETGDLAGLPSLGISLANNGTLNFDTEDFAAALSSDYSDVMGMLTGTGGFFADLDVAVDFIADPSTGTLQSGILSLDDQIEAYDARIADAQERLDDMATGLRGQFTALEGIMARWQTVGDFLTQQLEALNSANN